MNVATNSSAEFSFFLSNTVTAGTNDIRALSETDCGSARFSPPSFFDAALVGNSRESDRTDDFPEDAGWNSRASGRSIPFVFSEFRCPLKRPCPTGFCHPPGELLPFKPLGLNEDAGPLGNQGLCAEFVEALLFARFPALRAGEEVGDDELGDARTDDEKGYDALRDAGTDATPFPVPNGDEESGDDDLRDTGTDAVPLLDADGDEERGYDGLRAGSKAATSRWTGGVDRSVRDAIVDTGVSEMRKPPIAPEIAYIEATFRRCLKPVICCSTTFAHISASHGMHLHLPKPTCSTIEFGTLP